MQADQFAHAIKLAVAQQSEMRPFLYGHIASYDAALHRVRCIIPSMTDQDGVPTLSPWMPIGTLAASGGAGVQVIYAGGASAANPTAGEQVLIAMFDRFRGVAAVPCVFYHANNRPPSNHLPTDPAAGYSTSATPSQPNDIIISAPAATAGGSSTFIRVRQSGDVEVWAAGNVTADVIGNVTIYTNGNVSVTAQGTATVCATAIQLAAKAGDALQALCKDAFRLLFNGHTHGTGPIPNQQAGADTVTSIVTAE
jgi:hypothetical protein